MLIVAIKLACKRGMLRNPATTARTCGGLRRSWRGRGASSSGRFSSRPSPRETGPQRSGVDTINTIITIIIIPSEESYFHYLTCRRHPCSHTEPDSYFCALEKLNTKYIYRGRQKSASQVARML